MSVAVLSEELIGEVTPVNQDAITDGSKVKIIYAVSIFN